MSENIQSISQGTYTIGQTSATNFVAGPGIKIDQPSEGVVRIGNDETVLYDGNSVFQIDLSESVYNFRNLEIYMQTTGENLPAQKIEIDSNRTTFSVEGTWVNDGNEIYSFGSLWNIYNNGLSVSSYTKGIGNVINNGGGYHYFTNNLYNGTIRKIVGINRISGSNA